MESLISLQSEGLRSIGEPTVPRPSGVQQQGAVLVVVDVSKDVAPAAVHWTLGNVVRKGDHLKILGIITHVPNPMGFMVRVDQSTRNHPNIMELQFEIATKKEAIWRTAFLKDWCEKAEGFRYLKEDSFNFSCVLYAIASDLHCGVKLEVDVKAGNNPKVIASDEAKAMGACHVILDKTMKKDRKYFVDNLSCFVSRIRSNGGVDTLRSFAMSNYNLLPMAPIAAPKAAISNSTRDESGHQSRESFATTTSSSCCYRGSSMSSTTFELGGDACDDFSAQEVDPVAMPGAGDMQGNVEGGKPGDAVEHPPPQLLIRVNPQLPNPLVNFLRTDNNQKRFNLNTNSSSAGTSMGTRNGTSNSIITSNCNGLNWNGNSSNQSLNWTCSNSGSKSVGLTWPPTPCPSEPSAPLTPRAEFRIEQGPLHYNSSSFASFQFNLVPELMKGQLAMSLGRPSSRLTPTSLQTPASFQQHSIVLRVEKITMDLHWPLMHWADERAFKLRSQGHGSSSLVSSSSNSSLNNFRGRRRSVVSGLNYSDMVDSD